MMNIDKVRNRHWSNARAPEQCGHCGAETGKDLYQHLQSHPQCGTAFQFEVDAIALQKFYADFNEAKELIPQLCFEESWTKLRQAASNAETADWNIRTLKARLKKNETYLSGIEEGTR